MILVHDLTLSTPTSIGSPYKITRPTLFICQIASNKLARRCTNHKGGLGLVVLKWHAMANNEPE